MQPSRRPRPPYRSSSACSSRIIPLPRAHSSTTRSMKRPRFAERRARDRTGPRTAASVQWCRRTPGMSPLDTTRTQAFAEQALGIVNGGLLSLMLSVGHRTGLFDTLATLPPSTSEQIAAAAGLNERYVREWLGAMVTGRIMEYDPAARTYWLPREHAAALTRGAGPDNLAEFAQYVSLLGQVETAIVDVFRKGGGVNY